MLAVPSPSRRRPPIFFPGSIPPDFCSVTSRGCFCRWRRLPSSAEAVGSGGPSRGAGWRSLLRRCSVVSLGPAERALVFLLKSTAWLGRLRRRRLSNERLTSDQNDPNGFLFHCQLPMDVGLHMENPRARWLERGWLSPCGAECRWEEALAAQWLRELERCCSS